MPNQKDYINAIHNFANSMYYMADSITELAKNSNKTNTDTWEKDMRDMTTTMSVIAEGIEEVIKDSKETKDNTQAILKEIKSLKGAKEKGFFEKISLKGTEKGKNLADGMKSIVLMAGGIMALGLAFKVVGDVDFQSVIALSVALPIMVKSYEMAGDLDVDDSIRITKSLVIMSSGLMASGLLLQFFPEINEKKLNSLLGVTAATSITMLVLTHTANNIKSNKIKDLALIAGIIPIVSLGILLSGAIFTQMPILDWNIIESTLITSLAIGAAMIPLGLVHWLVGGITIEEWGEFAISTLIVSTAITASAMVLDMMSGVNLPDPLELGKFAIALGVSTLAFGLATVGLQKMKATPATVGKGALVMLIAAVGLMATSWILSAGNYGKYPDIEWAKNVGISVAGFGLAAFAFGAIITATGGIGAIALAAGLLAIVGTAATIAGVGDILASGNYGKYPSLEWATGAGLAIAAFGGGAFALGAIILGTLGLGLVALWTGLKGINRIAQGMNDVALIFNEGDYRSMGPSKRWIGGVAESLTTYGILALSMPRIGNRRFTRMRNLVISMNEISNLFLNGNYNDKKVPSKKWIDSVDYTLTRFAGLTSNASLELYDKSGATTMLIISGILGSLSQNIASGNYGKHPSQEWSSDVVFSINTFASGLLNNIGKSTDILEQMKSVLYISKFIPAIANVLDGAEYSDAPPQEWSEGIRDFVNSMLGINNENLVDVQMDSILKLSDVFLVLAQSIGELGKTLWSLDGAPSLSTIYEGIMLLSLIDNEALYNTLNVVDKHNDAFQSIVRRMTSVGTGEIDTSAINRDSMPKTKGKVNKKPEGNINKENAGVSIKEKISKMDPTLETNNLLNQLIASIEKNTDVLNQIRTNTLSKKASTVTNS